MPDQNADGYPYGCTGYAQVELCNDEDGAQYDPAFTYKQTCALEGHDMASGCLIRNSLATLLAPGPMPKGESDPAIAGQHRRGAYFNVELVDGLDWFDSVRSALYLNRAEKRAVSIGTPWYPSFNQSIGGLVALDSSNVSTLPWHNWGIVGWGRQYLICKPWQGQSYGDKGYLYFSRQTFNDLMSIRGTGAFTTRAFRPEDVATVKASAITSVLFYIRQLISLGYLKEALVDLAVLLGLMAPPKSPETAETAPDATPAPQTPEAPQPAGALLRPFCEAIQSYEGKPGDISYRLNNPGNLNYAGQPHAKPHVIMTSNGPHTFAEFDTMEHGFQALEAQVRYVASGECSRKNPASPYAKKARALHLADTSDLSIVEYFEVYSPTIDGNDPERYGKTVAKEIGVPVETPLKKLLA